MCCFEHSGVSLDFARSSECFCRHNCLGENAVVSAALLVLLSAVQAVVHLVTGEALLHVGRDQLLFLHTWCLTLSPSIVCVKANGDGLFVLHCVRIGR